MQEVQKAVHGQMKGCDSQSADALTSAKRILIVGCSGSGKSTLARTISARTGLPVVHLDQLYWRDNWTNVSADEFDRLLQAALAEDRWIIDGNFSRTLEMRLAHADTVIWLDLPAPVCLLGALKRVFGNYGKVRPDMAPNCPERFNWPFVLAILGFNRRSAPKLEKMLGPDCPCAVYRLRSRSAVNRLLKTL